MTDDDAQGERCSRSQPRAVRAGARTAGGRGGHQGRGPRADVARRDPPLTFEGLSPDDVVEIELQDGLRIWIAGRRPAGAISRRARSGGQAPAPSRCRSELAIGPASRALGGWAIKGAEGARASTSKGNHRLRSAHVEGQLKPGPGLYRCSEDDASNLQPVRHRSTGAAPCFVFLHGTASSTSGSFSGLWDPQAGSLIKPLFEYYGGTRARATSTDARRRAQSRTRSCSPTRWRGLLGANAEVHLVSHSRGGLVGELLARGMRTGARAVHARRPGALRRRRPRARSGRARGADARCSSARSRITRFVRVACPARGTTLADRRLDRYVSVLVNLASMMPGLQGEPRLRRAHQPAGRRAQEAHRAGGAARASRR